MRAVLRQEDIESPRLSWLCIEPALLSVRAKDLAAKAAVYKDLNEGQQALFLFYAFHNHVQSPAELYWFAAYSIIELRSWQELGKGMRYFGNNELVQLLEQTEQVIEASNKLDGQWKTASPSDLERDMPLYQKVEQLFDSYMRIVPAAIARMNEHILENKDEYIEGV